MLVFISVSLFVVSYVTLCSGNALDWSTYGFTSQRQCINPKEYVISKSSASQLRQKWVVNFPSPLVAQAVIAVDLDMTVTNNQQHLRSLKTSEGWTPPIAPHRFGSVTGENNTCTDAKLTRTMAYAGDIAGNFYAIDVDEGCVVWQASLGAYYDQGCGDLPSFGITGTAVFDRSVNTIYTMTGLGVFYALSMQTGAILWTIPNAYDNTLLFSYGSLLLYNSMVYFTLGSRCDIGLYQGGVTAVSIITRTPLGYVFHPSNPPYYGGGMWGLAGLTMNDPSAPSAVFYGPTGNSIGAPVENTDYCEEVLGFYQDLSLAGSTSVPFNPLGETDDNDFGSSAVFFNGPSEPRVNGCTKSLIAAGRKDGFYFVFNADTYATVQTIQLQTSYEIMDYVYQGAWDATTSTLVVPVYGNGNNTDEGLSAYTLGANCKLTRKWHTPLYHVFTPAIAGPANQRVVFVGGVFQFFALDLNTGKILFQTGTSGFAFNSPSVTNGVVFLSVFNTGSLFAYNISGVVPTKSPTRTPSYTRSPTRRPSARPSKPTNAPSSMPTAPTESPSVAPTCEPTIIPTQVPTSEPSILPTSDPTLLPTILPSFSPTIAPTSAPSSTAPSSVPSTFRPTFPPTVFPSSNPSLLPSVNPSFSPSLNPTSLPSSEPSMFPSLIPTLSPTSLPSSEPSLKPSPTPTLNPTNSPSSEPSMKPSKSPTVNPSTKPSRTPTFLPTNAPTSVLSSSTSPQAPSLNNAQNVAGNGDTSASSSTTTAIVASVVVVLFVIAIAVFIAVYYVIPRRREQARKVATDMEMWAAEGQKESPGRNVYN